jgi:hypothetical protein
LNGDCCRRNCDFDFADLYRRIDLRYWRECEAIKMHDESASPALQRQLWVSAILALWDRGFDTWQIAKTLRDDQAGIERGLHEGLALRRREKEKSKRMTETDEVGR